MSTEYAGYTASDFAADAAFQQWILQPNQKSEAFWQDFVQKHPDKQAAVAEAKNLLLQLQQDTDAPAAGQKERVWKKIEHRLAHEDAASVRAMPARVFPMWHKMAAAAAMILFVTAAYLLFIYSPQPAEYMTGSGEKKVFLLPDGSEVTLNEQSSLKLLGAWNGSQSRKVWLQGEAFFKITKKPGSGNARFIVQTKDLHVEVLGTRFNVKSRQESTQVVLSEGKVKVNSVYEGRPQPTVYMVPGESVVVRRKHKITKSTVKPALYLAWKSNELVLDKTSLREIGTFLQDNYGLSVQYESDSLAGLVLDGTALPTADRDYFLRAVATALDIEVVLRDEQVTFRQKPD